MTICEADNALLSSNGEAGFALRRDPWPHLVLDGFLPGDVLEKALQEVRRTNVRIRNGAARQRADRILASQEQDPVARDLHPENFDSLSAAFGVKVALNKQNLLQLRRMNNLTPDFPLHNDFTSQSDTIASFLYLGPGWTVQCGGVCTYLHLATRDARPYFAN